MLGVEADTTGASASAVHSKAGTRPSTADKPDVAAAATATPAASQITLTLWVHSPEQYATTATSTTNIDNASTSTSKRDVKEAADDTGSENATTGPPPLSTALCTEVVLAQELFKDKNSFGIQLQPGDLVEIFKTSVARPGSARPTSSGEHPNPRSSLRSAAALVFKVEKSCIAPDNASSQLQISVTNALATAFGLENRDHVSLRKLQTPLPKLYIADHVELYFKDQYLGRADMHRMSLALADTCVYLGQKIQLTGLSARATVGGLWVDGKQRRSALITSDTRTVFRSESCKFYIFVQLSEEMWSFDDDGSLFFEKAVDLFLPELFERWRKRETNHVVSLIAFARIMHDAEEIQLQSTADKSSTQSNTSAYTDVYRVIVDLETNPAWAQVLTLLRREFHAFQRETLTQINNRQDGITTGRVSRAHEGGVLEAINMAVSALDKHYVDRDLQRTGLSIILITAGTSRFNVDKNLLRLTTERLIDEGFGVDCVSLAKMPLHAVPLFRYHGAVPNAKMSKVADLLYVDDPNDAAQEDYDELYSIPHWIDSSFYAKHQDKPFRCDRFMPRCRMPQIQRIGVDEYENADINLPMLKDEMQYLVGMNDAWHEMSQREKRHKLWERFDDLMCGVKGRHELLDLEERKKTLSGKGGVSGIYARSGTSSSSTSSSASTAFRPQQSIRDSLSNGNESSISAKQTELITSNASMADETSVSVGTSKASPLLLADSPLSPPPQSESTVTESRTSTPRKGFAPLPHLGQRRPRSDSQNSASTLSRGTGMPSLSSPVSPSVTLSHVAVPGRVLASPINTRSTPLTESADTAKPPVARSSNVVKSNTSALAALKATQAAVIPKAEQTGQRSSSGIASWFWGRGRKASTATSSQSPSPAKVSKDLSPAPQITQSSAVSAAVITDDLPTISERTLPPSPSPSVVSQTSSAAASRPPTASLSITPAVPTQAISVAPNQTIMLQEHRPKPPAIGSVALQITSSDILADPRSLEENSMRAYFLEAAHQGNINARRMKETIRQARVKRTQKLNPSYPSMTSSMVLNQSRRWINIFPRAGKASNQRSVKWKSLCTPACLPLYSDFVPSDGDLSGFRKTVYSLPVVANTSSCFVKASKNVTEAAGNLIRELVCQRLAQSFQILMPTYEDMRRKQRFESEPSLSDVVRLPRAHQIRDILYNTKQGEGKALYLGFSNSVHMLHFDRASCAIVVTLWREDVQWSAKAVEHNYMLAPCSQRKYQPMTTTFSYPDLNGYDWQHLDKMAAGSSHLAFTDRMRHWRTRFIILPCQIPDPEAVIAGNRKLLGGAATDGDIHTAGIMLLYESFSKARWLPQHKGATADQLSSLSYSNTVLDPSLFAAEEAFRMTGKMPLSSVPLPDAYEADQFVSDFTQDDLIEYMLTCTRPFKTVPRRRNFKNHAYSFPGDSLVAWLEAEFVDVFDRQTAVRIAQDLLTSGHIVAFGPSKHFSDNYSFYHINPNFVPASVEQPPQFVNTWQQTGASVFMSAAASSKDRSGPNAKGQAAPITASPQPSIRYDKIGRVCVPMSHSIVINLDPQGKSDRSETAVLHFDIAHNPANGFHFQLEWMCTSSLVDDILTAWRRSVGRFGYRLIEGNIRQIKDVSLDNPFRALELIRFVEAPPHIPNLGQILGRQAVIHNYLQREFLQMLDYKMDIEADSNFAEHLTAEYSYRKTPCTHTQFMHESGSCFVQILDDGSGLLFLKNRLYLSHKQRARSDGPVYQGEADPAKLRQTLVDICSDRRELRSRWNDIAQSVYDRSMAMERSSDVVIPDEDDGDAGSINEAVVATEDEEAGLSGYAEF